jgi:hypothetical protein
MYGNFEENQLESRKNGIFFVGMSNFSSLEIVLESTLHLITSKIFTLFHQRIVKIQKRNFKPVKSMKNMRI